MLRFVKWYKNGYVTTQELNGGYTSDLFKKQEAVMCIGSSAGAKHQIPEKVNDKYPFEAGITSIPQINPSNPKVISQGPSVCIFRKKNTEEVKASWLFLKYLTTNASFQADFSIASGYVPVIKSAAEDPVYQEQMAAANGHEGLPQLSAKVCIEQEHAYYASPAFYGSSKARDEVGSLIQSASPTAQSSLTKLKSKQLSTPHLVLQSPTAYKACKQNANKAYEFSCALHAL